ncbi:hypothetical protein FHS19_002473 [Paenibacillus rhizosphaerae]|uniref:Uncharacterized protein n=1 Tax=Paenibacillus rhizosphaerae TaxID=297318 RepID=A0A839TR70_9BACL|nr:hypothetical protein [Paenibacillus rhizosphaerae]MBB3127819.1 hypothetical protein [Paenibacillus rhizosphaerae]
MIKSGSIWQSVTFGLLFAVLALGLLPFVVIYSLTELYGMSEAYEWLGIAPLHIFSRHKKSSDEELGRHGAEP